MGLSWNTIDVTVSSYTSASYLVESCACSTRQLRELRAHSLLAFGGCTHGANLCPKFGATTIKWSGCEVPTVVDPDKILPRKVVVR